MRFLPGVELARITYERAVRPILDSELPGLRHSAALLGNGSEVLGYDTDRSTGHGWGPRVLLFVGPEDAGRHAGRLVDALARRLPTEVAGWSTAWARSRPDGSWMLTPAVGGSVAHRVEVHDLGVWLTAVLGVDPRGGMTVGDWLAVPSQLLLERRYAPYSKWLGAAFAELDCAGALGPHLAAALDAGGHAAREAALCRAYELVAGLHNRLAITGPVEPTVRRFHDRPFLVLDADRFVAACRRAVVDPEVRALTGEVGAVDQFVDSTDVLSHGPRARRVAMALSRPPRPPAGRPRS